MNHISEYVSQAVLSWISNASQLVIFCAIASIFILQIAFTVPLIASYYNQNRFLNEGKTISAEFTTLNKALETEPPPPPPPPPAAEMEQKARFVPPVVTTDTVTEMNALNVEELALKVTNEALTDQVVVTLERPAERVIEQEEEDKSPPFTVVEEMPAFPVQA